MNDKQSLTDPRSGALMAGQGPGDYPDFYQEEELDLRKYWRVIRKHFWSILGLASSVAILTYLVLLTLTPIYKATSSLIIEPKARQKVISIDDVVGLDTSGAEYFMTQIEVLKSQSIARRVIDSLPADLRSGKPAEKAESSVDEGKLPFWKEWFGDLDWPDWYKDLMAQSEGADNPLTMDPMDKLAVELLEHLTITPIRNTHIIQIAFEDPSPKRAMLVANGIAQAYIDAQSDTRVEATQQSSRWLADRVEKLRGDLLSSEKHLTEYMEAQGLVSLGQGGKDQTSGVMSLNAEELSDRQAKLNEARKKTLELETLYRQVAGLSGNYPDFVTSLPGIYENAGVQTLKAQENEAAAEVKRVAAKYGAQHPERRAAESHLESVRSALQRQIGVAVSGLRNQFEAAKANEAALSQGFEQSKSKAHDISRKDSRLNELRRQVETNRNLYEMFFNRLKETTETRDLASTNATVLDQAQPPTVPAKPQKKKLTLLSGVLALLLGVGLAFLLEQLDTTLKSPEEIEEKLGIPFLGLLPFDKATQDGNGGISYNDDGLSSFAESVRSIRTGVIFGTLNHARPVITITSSGPGEGKTTAILNLAASMAQLKRVLLIEADLRKPQLGKRLNLPARAPGICNLIVGNEDLTTCIYPIRENLDLIPSGRIPPNPLEMLSSPRFAELIDVFRAHYDIIIIDAPPVGPVSDPLILSRIADAVLFVIRAQKSQVRQVQQAVSKLRRVQAPLTGVILNFADAMRNSGYKYQSYYYNYGYGYGEYKTDKADHDEA